MKTTQAGTGRDPAHRFAPIERLARRVLGGEVVFFIGAGFSIDSERNTAYRWAARLLARLLALGTCLTDEAGPGPSPAREILDGLGRVFDLEPKPFGDLAAREPARCMTQENVKRLSREYYNFNEWATSALGVLSTELFAVKRVPYTVVSDRSHRLENFLLSTLGSDDAPLEDEVWKALRCIERGADRGKALFLDTMGFANREIMCGEPAAPDIATVASSYRDRLRPRHHALARLAREGLLPILVTTNYDLLLDGAFRLAGFTESEGAGAATRTEWLPPTQIPRFSRVAGGDQFFRSGDGHRAALILKIHGCVESYRIARNAALALLPAASDTDTDSSKLNAWAAYLPSLVFTYREIQTWRSDAWSRDLIRTLLRTRTLALAGYSGADPVLHATFREVYEEMAESRRRRPGDCGEPKDAPIFFFAVKGKREFHSLEILRAATEARGDAPGRLVEHPNHVECDTSGGFPSIDDHFRWLSHRVLRTIQMQAIEARLRRLALRLLGNPCRDRDFTALVHRFRALVIGERRHVRLAVGPARARLRFESVVGWTWNFLPGLLRELALAEMVESEEGPGRTLRSVRRWPWYYPANERLEWTAWAAVLELAIRNMVADWRRRAAGGGSLLESEFDWIEPVDSPYAAVAFSLGKDRPSPVGLCIRLAGFERAGRSPALPGAFQRVVRWELSERDVPWCETSSGLCPSAVDVWKWALAKKDSKLDATSHLGG